MLVLTRLAAVTITAGSHRFLKGALRRERCGISRGYRDRGQPCQDHVNAVLYHLAVPSPWWWLRPQGLWRGPTAPGPVWMTSPKSCAARPRNRRRHTSTAISHEE